MLIPYFFQRRCRGHLGPIWEGHVVKPLSHRTQIIWSFKPSKVSSMNILQPKESKRIDHPHMQCGRHLPQLLPSSWKLETLLVPPLLCPALSSAVYSVNELVYKSIYYSRGGIVFGQKSSKLTRTFRWNKIFDLWCVNATWKWFDDGFSGSISLLFWGGLETRPPLPPQFSTFLAVVMPTLLREAIVANLRDRAVKNHGDRHWDDSW